MSAQRDRDEFIAIMTHEGLPLDVARTLMRHATTLHRLAELECSSEAADRDRVPCPGIIGAGGDDAVCLCRGYGTFDAGHGMVPRIAVREARLQQRIDTMLRKYHITPVFSGDPRGAVLKLKVPSGRTNDWGQTGICVP